MSSPSQLPVSLPPSGSQLWVVLPYCVAVVTGLGGWFAAQFTAVAQLQKILLDASRKYVEESQATHARDIVRNVELEAEILRLRGQVNGLIQWQESIRHWAERSGYTLPR